MFFTASIGPPIGSGVYAALNDLVVLAGRRDNLFGFEDIVRLRLLAIHVLARLDSPDRLQRVVVVRRGDGDRVDVFFLLEQLSKVDIAGRTLPPDDSTSPSRLSRIFSSMSQIAAISTSFIPE